MVRLQKNETANKTLAADLQPSQLEGMGRCQVPGVTTHEFYVNKSGELFVKGLVDCNLSGPQFLVHGRAIFRTLC